MQDTYYIRDLSLNTNMISRRGKHKKNENNTR